MTSPEEFPDHLSTEEKRADSISKGVAEWVKRNPDKVTQDASDK